MHTALWSSVTQRARVVASPIFPVVSVFLGLLLTAFPPQAAAQSVVHDSVKARLAAIVHLPRGATSLAQVMKALSEQTGLQMETEDYMQSHQLVLQLGAVSAATALNTLAELNHWRWHETPQQGILLTRFRSNPPTTLPEVSLALQAALPFDLQRLFGSTGGLRDTMYIEDLDPARQPQGRDAVHMNGFRRLRGAGLERQDRLYALLKGSLSQEHPLAYAQMTAEQQHALLVVLIMQSLGRLHSGEARNLFLGVLRPYELDPAGAELTVDRENYLMIGSRRILGPQNEIYTGFGFPTSAPASEIYVPFAPSSH